MKFLFNFFQNFFLMELIYDHPDEFIQKVLFHLFSLSLLILFIFPLLAFLGQMSFPGEDLYSLKSHSKQVKVGVIWSDCLKVPSLSLPSFRLSAQPYYIPTCNGSETQKMFLQGDFSSSAEFFVCVGVFGFLYCTATLILYLGYQNVYRQTTRCPIIVSTQEGLLGSVILSSCNT